MWYVCIMILLTAIILFLILRLVHFKKNLKEVNQRLDYIIQHDTNLILDSSVRNKEVDQLLQTINHTLIEVKRMKAKYSHEELELRQTIINLAHDIRTPITSVMGYLNLVSKNEREFSDKTKSYLQIINQRLETMKTLIDSLFSYSLLSENADLFESKQENINVILETTIAMFYQEFLQKKMVPVIHMPEVAVYKWIDKLALQRVFQNLLSNMMKYSCGPISITLTEAHILFENRTEAFDQIEVGKLFDRFFTVARARKDGSMGLGLTISKMLIERMHGTIHARLHDQMLAIVISLPSEKGV